MRWTPGGESGNIEDRRGETGGGGGFMIGGGRGLGIGGVVVLLILSVVFKQDFLGALGGGGPAAAPVDPGAPSAPVRSTPEEDKEVQFVSFVLDDVQRTWAKILPDAANVPYRDAKLVLFRGAVRSACGDAEAAMGPFYCPIDHKVYLDLGFFQELQQRFGAPGDFAQAYVIAHELGHHVQSLLGTDGKVRQLQQSAPDQANGLSVKLELQADCYAGVWAHSTEQRKVLDPGDIDEGLKAAAAVGDDRIQREQTGGVHPESFTHGSSQQRASWFRRGYESGQPQACNTFDNTRG